MEIQFVVGVTVALAKKVYFYTMGEHSRIVKIIISSLCIYFIVFFVLEAYRNIINISYHQPDSGSYIDAAKILFLEGGVPHSSRPYGIASIIGLPLLANKSFSDFYIWGWCINIIAWLITVLLVYKSILLFSNKYKRAQQGVLFFLFCFGIQTSTYELLSDVIFIPFLTGGFYFLIRFFVTQQTPNAFWSLLLLSCSILIRPGSLYLYILVLLYFVVVFLHKKNVALLFLLILTSLPLIFQAYSIKKQYGNFTISYIDKIALLYYIDIRAKTYTNHTIYETEAALVTKSIEHKSLAEISNMANKDFEEQVRTNKINLIKAYFFNLYENSTRGSYPLQTVDESGFSIGRLIFKQVLHFITRIENIIFSIFVLFILPFILIRYKKEFTAVEIKILSSVFIFSVYFILISALSFWQHDRFHYVFYAISIMGLILIWNRLQSRLNKLTEQSLI